MNLKFSKTIWRLSLFLFVTAPLMLAFQNFAPPGESIDAEGEIEVMIEDHAHTSHTRYFLKTDKGSLELKLNRAQERQAQAGAKVRVKGMKNGEVLALDGSATMEVTAPAPALNISGDRKMVILLVNFQDNPIQPYTLATANSVLSQVNNFMKENSLNLTSVSGASYGWYTLPIATTCSDTLITANANQAAANAGVNLSAYNHFVYVFPRNTACPWSGVANLSGSIIMVNGSLNLKTVAHELGHNFGLYHSHSLECGASVDGSSCTALDYGDALDMMGNANPGHFNPFQKERLGWLNNGSMPPITSVSSSGDYLISTYEAANSGAKALKILKSTNATTGAKTYYYVEFRQPIGVDAFITSMVSTYGSNVASGVMVRIGTENNGSSSYLLDMTPASTTFDWYDSALLLGRSYIDSVAGVTITTKSISSSGAVVTVSLSGSTSPAPVCTKANPIITPSSQTKSGAAGSVISYSVSVKNQDSSACAASSFSLSRSLPAGWVATLSPSSVSLSPGGSASVTMTVTSPASSTGNNNIIVNAISGAYSGSATAIYSVTAAAPAPVCTKANPIITPSSQTKSGLAGSAISYSVSVKNQDSSACAASSFSISRSLPVGWVATLSPSSVSLSPGASANVTLTITSPSSAVGSNNIIVNAISGAYSGSAIAIYSVTAPPVTSFSVTASADKSVYLSGEIVLANAKVLSGSTAVANASVSFQVIDPRGKSTTYNAVSDASGVAKISYSLGNNSPKGVYQIKVNATSQSLSGSGSVNFTKQ